MRVSVCCGWRRMRGRAGSEQASWLVVWGPCFCVRARPALSVGAEGETAEERHTQDTRKTHASRRYGASRTSRIGALFGGAWARVRHAHSISRFLSRLVRSRQVAACRGRMRCAGNTSAGGGLARGVLFRAAGQSPCAGGPGRRWPAGPCFVILPWSVQNWPPAGGRCLAGGAERGIIRAGDVCARGPLVPEQD